jgi:RNA polymerase subunit RPABC4/transcription elongation factor Spt4
MAKKTVCKKCKIFIDEKNQCPICQAQGSLLSTSWQGRINILNAKKSFIAKKAGYSQDGEYAIKIR